VAETAQTLELLALARAEGARRVQVQRTSVTGGTGANLYGLGARQDGIDPRLTDGEGFHGPEKLGAAAANGNGAC
jgi:hypothetical protein